MGKKTGQTPSIYLVLRHKPPVVEGAKRQAKHNRWLLPGMLEAMSQTAQEVGGRLAVIATVESYDPDNVDMSVFRVNPADNRHFIDGTQEPIRHRPAKGLRAVPCLVSGDMVELFGTPPDDRAHGIEWRNVLPAVVQSQISA